jgi:competence protein ComEA
MAATPQERLALGVAALLLAAGAAARMLTAGPPPAELSGPPGVERSASALAKDVAAAVEKEARRNAPLAAGEKIDVNTASVDELVRLPKVGPAVAQRIVDRRTARGPFRTMADLDSVPGVGPALLAAAQPHLSLRPAPVASSTRGSFQSAASVADWDRSPDKVTRTPPASSGALVDINTASVQELDELLPDVGPAIARNIVEHRRAKGRFRAVDELKDVNGIGPARLERLRPHVRVTP